MTGKELLSEVAEGTRRWLSSGAVDTVVVAFPDHLGRLMGKRLCLRHFLDHVAGSGVEACNYLLAADVELTPLPGFPSIGWHKGYGDFHLVPDLATLRPAPWFEGSAVVLCDLQDGQGRPVAVAPRQILKNQLDALAAEGRRVEAASELEFYLFDAPYSEAGGGPLAEPTTAYIVDYDLLGTSRDEPVLRRIRNSMNAAGVTVEGSKGEWGRGQHEVNLAHAPALEAADRHVLFKQGVKVLAAEAGLSATFMAKPATELAGSSCHLHVNLLDSEGRNLFWDESGATRLFRSFVAGCTAYLPELALFLAPTVNSYKRFRSGTFAPVNLAWGYDNRTCGLRVVGKGQSFRVEVRVAGADANPYLALAAILTAGMQGVQEQLEPPDPVPGNAYELENVARLPSSLAEAADRLRESTLARRAFGSEVVGHYARLAELEQAEADRHVTDWERRRYFERI